MEVCVILFHISIYRCKVKSNIIITKLTRLIRRWHYSEYSNIDLKFLLFPTRFSNFRWVTGRNRNCKNFCKYNFYFTTFPLWLYTTVEVCVSAITKSTQNISEHILLYRIHLMQNIHPSVNFFETIQFLYNRTMFEPQFFIFINQFLVEIFFFSQFLL